EVERLGVDIAEDGRHALIEQAVGRGDEAERGRDHLVARTPAGHPHGEVKRRRARGDGHGIRRADVGGELALEALLNGPQREPARAQDLEHELLLALAQLRPRERNPLVRHYARPCSDPDTPGREAEDVAGVCSWAGTACSWKAYSSEST